VDEEMLLDRLAPHQLIVTVEEHSIYGGLGGLIAELVTSAGAAPRVERIGVQDTWGESAGNDYMLTKHGLSAELVAQRVAQVSPVRQ
jgi:transketolase